MNSNQNTPNLTELNLVSSNFVFLFRFFSRFFLRILLIFQEFFAHFVHFLFLSQKKKAAAAAAAPAAPGKNINSFCYLLTEKKFKLF